MKHLYFIRHGRTEMNEAGLLASHTETPLTAQGKAQALEAGKQARQLHIDYIISSPLSRAHDTARIIAREIGYLEEKIELSDLLVERHFGSAEGVPYSRELDIEAVPDAETLTSLQSRLEQLLQYIQTIPADNVLVVSHGSTGRMLRHVATPGIPFHGTSEDHHLPNAQIVQLI